MSEEKKVMLRISDVSMRFRKEEDHAGSLKETVINMFAGRLKFTEFYALQHVSFDVYKGDVLGIIGRNGA